MSPRPHRTTFAPRRLPGRSSALLLGLFATLLGATGCPGHLDQLGWEYDGGGPFASKQPGNDPVSGSGGSGGNAGSGNAGGGGNAGSAGSGGGGGSTARPPTSSDGGGAPDGGRAPDAMTNPTPMTPPVRLDASAPADATAPPPAPDAMVMAQTPACATAAEISAKILTPKCGSCHGVNAPAAGLDLVTTGIKARLVGITAKGCSGKVLAVAGAPGSPVTGYFFDKLVGAVSGCGGQMPFGAPPLSDVEIKCLKDWIKPTP